MEVIDNFIGSIVLNQKKGQITSTLNTIVDATRQSNQNQIEILALERKMTDNLKTMVAKEAPECNALLGKVMDMYSKTFLPEYKYVEAKNRSIEDLNDIQERFLVVVRQAEKFKESKTNLKRQMELLDQNKQKLEIERTKNSNKVPKLEALVNECKDNVRKAIEEEKIQIQKYIEEKKKFNAFRARRMKSSYLTLGKATQQSSETLSTTYTNLKGAIEEVKPQVTSTITPNSQ